MRAVRLPRPLRAIAFLLACVTGCYPLDRNAPEENHPLIKAAEARKSTNPGEAARLLDKALSENPRLARAHWELGLICLNSISNYAAAVYHFQKVLELRPDWPHASTTRQLISNAKLELVKEGVEAPSLPSVQRQMDRLVGELHRLTQLNTNLMAQVGDLTVVTQRLAAENLNLRQQLLALNQSVPPTEIRPDAPTPTPKLPGPRSTNPASPRPSATNPAALSGPRGTRPPFVTPRSGIASRTHVVQRGETAFAVCRRYGIAYRDLVAANPGLDPARLKAGQRLNLPAR